jgi:parallel beta-helix repeat protein
MKTVYGGTKHVSLITSLLILSFAFALFTGCKKDASQQSQTSSALTNAKADIVVHSGESIQAAVDAAAPGMLIQILPGTYQESITVAKAGIQLVGVTEEGMGVIIQNPGNEVNGINVTDAGDGFLLRNVTVRDFSQNGVHLDGVDNFTISHVTVIDNREFGIFAAHSSHGMIDHCTASGHSDTGIHVGESTDLTMQFNVAFENVNGLESENSSNVNFANNQSYRNSAGILISLLPGRDVKTSANISITRNHVYNNNHENFAIPGHLASFIPPGLGILILGTDQTTIENNTLTQNNFEGVTVFSTLVLAVLAGIPPSSFDIEPNPDGTRIVGNVVQQNGAHPVTLPIPLPGVDLLWDGSGLNNCWSDNHFKSSYPSILPSCN